MLPHVCSLVVLETELPPAQPLCASALTRGTLAATFEQSSRTRSLTVKRCTSARNARGTIQRVSQHRIRKNKIITKRKDNNAIIKSLKVSMMKAVRENGSGGVSQESQKKGSR
ncbi:hypothetical protein NDU88_004833 [Pleurodeles waltl]|uniref:Secreted protein n=1 Tax=Pleurodeles waltl TaxID=8319 RepID=A0AAV7NPQ0_PLEWA|nr:hypothetical protein NDU88_004833 [Pleurodeles waltl]